MNVQLVLRLSLLGLIVGIGSVTGIIHSGAEGYVWLVIGLFSALVIGRGSTGRSFLHGFLVGFVACLFSVLVQVVFFPQYLQHNPEALKAFQSMPTDVPPRVLVLLLTPIVAAFNGVVVGFFSWVAARLLGRKPTVAT